MYTLSETEAKAKNIKEKLTNIEENCRLLLPRSFGVNISLHYFITGPSFHSNLPHVQCQKTQELQWFKVIFTILAFPGIRTFMF